MFRHSRRIAIATATSWMPLGSVVGIAIADADADGICDDVDDLWVN